MKRILYIAAALLLTACSRELIPETIPQEEKQESKTYTVTFTASFDPETRLAISTSNGVGSWEQTDEIALFTHNGQLVKGTIKDGDYNINTPKFTFEIEEGDSVDENAIAYYPYSIAVEGQPNQISLPASYENASGQYKTIPMKAVASETGTNLSFKHLASMVLVKIPNAPSFPGTGKNPTQILFETSKPISGTFTVGGTADAPTLSPEGNGNGNSITSPWIAGESHMYILPAGTYDQGFSISIKNNDGFVLYKKNRSSSFTATRATLVNMPALDVQDYKGTAFYLTGNETGWSNTATQARMIQVSKNSFIGGMYSSTGDHGNSDLGFKILPGNQMGDWNYVIGSVQNSNKALYGVGAGNFNTDQAAVYTVKITFDSSANGNENPWKYEVNHISDTNYDHGSLLLSGGFGDKTMTADVKHNWVTEVTVAEGTSFEPNHDYWWKIHKANDSDWTVQWGDGIINNNQLYSGVKYRENGYTPGNGTINLSAGTYDVFFNDAAGQIMFVKK